MKTFIKKYKLFIALLYIATQNNYFKSVEDKWK